MERDDVAVHSRQFVGGQRQCEIEAIHQRAGVDPDVSPIAVTRRRLRAVDGSPICCSARAIGAGS